jgi:hypothetical protein
MHYSTLQWAPDIKMKEWLGHMHLHILGGFDPISRGLHFHQPTCHTLGTVLIQKQHMLYHTTDILMEVLGFIDETV